ncbi:MAG: hypothetical protein HYZ27_08105, partial [Deltaproteobacteria bacterium]|nr:hypothetical protein [Deltaproteobacteria bacterium]
QSVNVSCTVTDAYGNPVSAPSSVVVMPASSAPQSGLVQSGMAFSATRAGLYYVFCAVPGYQAGDESPALVRVHPGLPCTWAYDSLDTSGCFWQGRRLPFYYEVADFWGNVVDPAPVEMVAIPSTGVTSDGQGGWIFANEGDYALSFSVLQPHDTDSTHDCTGLPGTVALPYIANIRVDSRGPQFSITSPARSAMLLQGGVADASVPISGSVTDTLSPITGLEVNDNVLTVSGTSLSESISQTQTSRWGMSAITGEVVDECGNRSVLAQSYLRSGQYFAAATAPSSGSRAITGILAHLNQPVIDDSNRVDINDMATMGERILLAQDFNALIPPGTVLASEPLRSGCSFCQFWNDTSYTVRRDDNASRRINVEGPYITYLRAINGGMDFAIRIDQFDFPLEAEGCWRTCDCGLQGTICTGWISGWAGADRIDASGSLGISLVGGVPTVVVNSITVNANGMYLNIDCGILDFVCDAITGSVMPYLESTIEGAMEDAIRDQIPPTLESFLSGFSLDTGFSLPPPMSM